MCRKLRRSLSWRVCRTVLLSFSPMTPLPWYSSCLHPKRHNNFIHLISMIIKQQTFVGSHSHHHEVELTISHAQSFKFKSDATKLCRRMARHRRGEPDGRCKQEGVELVMTKRDTPLSDERDGDWKTQRDLLEARNMDIQDEVVIIWASCSALDMITCHLPA